MADGWRPFQCNWQGLRSSHKSQSALEAPKHPCGACRLESCPRASGGVRVVGLWSTMAWSATAGVGKGNKWAGAGICTYLAGEISWSRRRFSQGEVYPLHCECVYPCNFLKCGKLNFTICAGGGGTVFACSPRIWYFAPKLVKTQQSSLEVIGAALGRWGQPMGVTQP